MDSSEKPLWHPAYGITKSGFDLKNLTRENAMSIAVDPRVIPMGSRVLLNFVDEDYKKYNGIYTARDVGGAIKGNKIDLFMGDFRTMHANPKTLDFGRVKAKVIVLPN